MQWEDRVGRRLKLRDLHTLQVVSEIGSMAKASRQLGLSQPAISKAIAGGSRSACHTLRPRLDGFPVKKR